MKASEGAMLKVPSHKWKIAKEPRTKLMSKVKNHKEIDCIVLDRHEVKGSKGVYNLICGVEIPCKDKDKWTPVVEYKGKCYLVLGKTYNVKTDANVGDIVEVRTIRMRLYRTEEGKTKLTWMHMIFIRKREDKKSPDTITTALRIVKAGIHPLSKEPVVYIRLLPCPYSRDRNICPLYDKFSHSDEELSVQVWKETLRYPIRCKLAGYYKCRYVKDYYYKPVLISKDIREWSKGVEDE